VLRHVEPGSSNSLSQGPWSRWRHQKSNAPCLVDGEHLKVGGEGVGEFFLGQALRPGHCFVAVAHQGEENALCNTTHATPNTHARTRHTRTARTTRRTANVSEAGLKSFFWCPHLQGGRAEQSCPPRAALRSPFVAHGSTDSRRQGRSLRLRVPPPRRRSRPLLRVPHPTHK
jgi:hypothetical protein